MSKENKTPPATKARVSAWVKLLMLLLIASSAASTYMGYQYKERFKGQFDSVEKDLIDSRQELSTQYELLNSKIERYNDHTQQKASDFDKKLDQILKVDIHTWVLAEVEMLIRAASMELATTGRVEVALSRLQEADYLLEDLNEPALSTIRQGLNTDINALKRIRPVDVNGLYIQLTSILKLVENLQPLPENTFVADPPDEELYEDRSYWVRVRNWVRDTFSGLFRLRDARDVPVEPLLDDAQIEALKRGLEINIMTARLALLRQDGDLWRDTLSEASEHLLKWFPANRSDVKQLNALLIEIKKEDIEPRVPDLMASSRALRLYRGQQR